MDELDLTKISSIPHHETIGNNFCFISGILNQYLINYTNHVNKMTDYSEKEMLEIDFMIDELEKKVIILEQKLGLENQSEN